MKDFPLNYLNMLNYLNIDSSTNKIEKVNTSICQLGSCETYPKGGCNANCYNHKDRKYF